MSINRINKAILCANVGFRSIEKIDFYVSASNPVMKDFCTFFLPSLKYSNYNVSWSFHPETNGDEKIVLFPKNNDVHIINLKLYKYSQQLYDRIVFLDAKFYDSLP
ncbi:conserved Plasmodium protein, unknown function [Plasmodium ovale wallikeri]|uniref:Uncharacterized protein n=2 Tax=Plasmodium ovale TaxID=36330 RepID=A0A1A8YY91_PLAOA|nr:conserved Plasmodium protein, unknown function [Plasmodium ovale wallikeri]SBT36968.1 conserved Plasmodium protein, unknown function [Plasmodium ovale wallikeri]SBT72999.1 conserved Plasmodium protein, unknown function [Plasmodium ovale]